MTYYNEFDPGAAEWLRELMKAGVIPTGEVDERDIREVQADDLRGFHAVHLFAGIGGWPYALRLAGWDDERPVWTGSCPCPPFSAAGKKITCPACSRRRPVPCPRRTGYFICIECEHAWHADERHLWPEFWRLIRDCRPSVVFGEQVAGYDGEVWFAGVRATLERIGYSAGAADLAAGSVGAPTKRQRLFWVADPESTRSGSAGQEEQEHGRGECESGRMHGGMAGELADADGGKPRNGRVQPGRKHGQQPENGSTARGVFHPASNGRKQRRAESDGIDADAARSLGVLGDSCCTGSQERGGDGGIQREEMGEYEGEAAVSACADSGFWDRFTVVICRDTDEFGRHKARRVEPGTFPLAHGIPDRVGLLRGYGNAICPQAAKAFIEAWLEATSVHTD